MTDIDYLLSEYKERIETLKQAIGAGNCASYEEYKYACGQVRGLESACFTITDLKQRMEKDDE